MKDNRTVALLGKSIHMLQILCNAIFTHNRSKTVYVFRDAWGFGALDPNSGTAQMMEVARVLGARLRTGWRPRRTIMFLRYCTVLYYTVLYCDVLHCTALYCAVLYWDALP